MLGRSVFTVLVALTILLEGCESSPEVSGCETSPGRSQSAPYQDIWLYDDETEELERSTVASGVGRESTAGSISADGNYIAFHSDSDFLGEDVPNGTDEIWLYDVGQRRLTRVTRASDPQRDSQSPSISADGSRIVFESDSDLLSDGLPRGQREIWLYDVMAGEFTRLTHAPLAGGSSGGAVISADGSTVAFHSSADFDTDNAPGQSTSIWLSHLETGALTRVTRSSNGGGRSLRPAINADGTRIAFESTEGLIETMPAQIPQEIWLYDVREEAFTRLTTTSVLGRDSEAAGINADGTKIVFHSDADLLGEGIPDGVDEVWLYDTESESLLRVTNVWDPERDAGANPVLHPDTQNPEITADGSKVIFASDGDFLEEGLPNGYPHVWVYDLSDKSLRCIDTSVGSGSGLAISANGNRMVLFRTPFDEIRGSRMAAPTRPPRPERLSGDAIGRDLDALQSELESRWAYLRTTGVDYQGAIASLRERARDGLDYDEYGIELQRIISLFVDGHAGVQGFRYPAGYAPFLVESSGGRYVAFRPDRSGFLDPEYPYLGRIDGTPLTDWIEAAAPFNPRGSPQYRVQQALRQIRSLQFQRDVMGIQQTDNVVMELVSEDGDQTRVVQLPVSEQGPVYGLWPRTQTGVLQGDVGYLRLPSMDQNAVQEVLTWMPQFRETRGLIVDVRGNGGGSRDALRALFPYMMGEDDAPRVVNTAVYRLHPDNGEDHLGGSRFMYREGWSGWSPAEREAIQTFKDGFEPEWVPPDGEFSDWHYLVLSRSNNPEAYVYGRPVVVLLDQKSFSATDIFLSAFKAWPGITLVGSASGGGSARRVGALLPESGFSLGLASMASFQWSGLLYDGHGTEPDIIVDPVPEYFLVGGRDNVMETALELLR